MVNQDGPRPGAGSRIDIGHLEQSGGSYVASLGYCATCDNDGLIWGINAFDQFGVELGKKTADAVRGEMAQKNQAPDHRFDHLDPITRFYLEALFRGSW